MNAAYECNGEPVCANAFYAIACDPRRSVAVEACAGAGKTWMLVSRIVRALLDSTAGGSADSPLRPQDILAITFTRKAAGEMRARLDEWLEKFAHADDATLQQELEIRGISETSSKKGPQPIQDVRRQLSNLYRSVLASGRSVQIRTFHGWFAALLRGAPVAVLQRLGLPVSYELLEDDAPARALVWRRFYATLVADASLKADFESVVRIHGRYQTGKALQTALQKRTEFTLADEKGVVDASVQPFGVQFPEFAGSATPEDFLAGHSANHQTLLGAAKALGGASAPTFSAKGVELEQALAAQDLAAVFTALLTKDGTPRKFGEKIIGIERVRQAQALALRMAAACQQHEAWLHQQRMARLTRALIAQFTQLKRERGWVDMNDVERAAFVMLSDAVLSGWVQERLDARIRHLMIDEFQDTNPLQWQALSSWLTGYSGAGSAPSVFLVGDPKQSIYRFRRAEPQVFKAAQRFVVQGLGGDLLSCDHTRRNALAVIDAVNAAMSQAREVDGYDGFREHTTDSGEVGQTGRLPPIPRDRGADDAALPSGWRDSLNTPRELPEETLRTLEARQAAAWIAGQIAGGLKPQDVMVLSRKRAGLLPLQQELRTLRIAAQIGEKTDLIDCCEVLDVVALLDVLVSPQHDLSLARALRSPLFGLGDASLVQLALLQREQPVPWYELLQKTELLAPELKGLASIFTRWKDWLDGLPPHDALQNIYTDGDVLARFVAAAPATQRSAVLANLRALLAASLAQDGGRYATPYGFVRALKAGGTQAPASLDPQAVRLLTIHGAKGLEAETVLLLDTDTVERSADSMSVLIDWPGEAAEPRKFVFLVSETRPPACAEDALAAEKAARKREEINALYVAMTRAKGTLAISSIEPHKPTTDSWWQRLQALMPPLDLPADHAFSSQSDASPDAGIFQLPELPALPEAMALKLSTETREDKDSLSARIGKAMHRLLEWGGAGSAPHAAAAAREFRLSPAQAAQAAALAQRIQAGEGAWAWRHDAIAWEGNEVDLVYQGQPLRLDRLVQRKDAGFAGQWWVLDYKSAMAPQQQPGLRAQLQAYRAAVQLIYPGATVKAAFLTGQGTLVELD
ncbi:MAG: UvrD-helicase domain-containing protein [Polaromonas sp.]|nr:UvrD-helicase domain-containing protein [Polaromonas sp.]